MMSKKIYYSTRMDTNRVGRKFDLESLRALFLETYKQFMDRDYFQEAFGFYCVDGGDIDGTVGNVGLHFHRKLKKPNLWPINENIKSYAREDIFDVIELLYDLVSKPVDGNYHSYNSCGWHYNTFNKLAGQASFRAEINEILEEYEEGYELLELGQIVSKNIDDPGQQIPFLTASSITHTTFDLLFQYGLPVSLQKPRGSVEHKETGQYFKFDENDHVGILRGNVYPNFCMGDLADWIDPDVRLRHYVKPEIKFKRELSSWHHRSWSAIYNLCQTETEKMFLQSYFSKFVLAYMIPDKSRKKYTLTLGDLQDKVPALIPQAWINWSSASRDALNRMGYKDFDLPYRLDFVIFWGNRNFAVMIDGIEHYAERIGSRWDAKEEKYAARLKEDRLLRIQGWNVFRVGNWEVKDVARLEQVQNELRKFVGFEEPPAPQYLEDEIPF